MSTPTPPPRSLVATRRAAVKDAEIVRLREALQRAADAIESAQTGTYQNCVICGGEIAHNESCIVITIRAALEAKP